MKGTIFSQILLLAAIAIASNSLLSLATKLTVNNVGSKAQEILISSCVPNSNTKGGKSCEPH
ncbi:MULTISPECIES: hypothetical protein [Kamptonema]|uniref:hypothetical protein n=1 Tax=Kamptonema TaxID=1501433 RepID=UPI0001DAC783|nr:MULTISPECIES: hypothetical protein [Kamptonema]CBN59123.1 exported hypothetical protein [Kamptonema sp. PCC 6506]